MLKIFVTGDNHIGLKYASHEQSTVLATARITAFENLVDIANSENCDLFVVTGDLFENVNGISKKDVTTVVNALSRFNGTCAVLPGNHDYYDPESRLWQHFKTAMSQTDNIILLSSYQPRSFCVNDNNIVIYPALCTSLHSAPGENNLGWMKNIDVPQDDVYRIGVAHGAVEGETIDSEKQYFTMRRSELEQISVDAWLIGHTHVPFPKTLTDTLAPCDKILNPGTHTQTDVACNTPGICFIVTLDEDKTLQAKKVDTGSIRFYRIPLTLTPGNMQSALRCELDPLCDNSVVELSLSGCITAEEYDSLIPTLTYLLSRFIESDYSVTSVSRLITDSLIKSEFAETSFAYSLLSSLMHDPQKAQLAYDLIKSIKEDGDQ